jgi:predicted DNA-binding protein with PD1-like motif
MIPIDHREFLQKKMIHHSNLVTIVLSVLLMLSAGFSDWKLLAQGRAEKPVLPQSGETRRMRILVLRLRPGQDLRQQLEAFVKDKKIRAGFMITAVGSLRKAAIRLADQPGPTVFDEKFEIVSLVGTLGQGGVHLHISISDKNGRTLGGHLVEGCLIYTTAEIVIGDAMGLEFNREQDTETGYRELKIRNRRHIH